VAATLNNVSCHFRPHMQPHSTRVFNQGSSSCLTEPGFSSAMTALTLIHKVLYQCVHFKPDYKTNTYKHAYISVKHILPVLNYTINMCMYNGMCILFNYYVSISQQLFLKVTSRENHMENDNATKALFRLSVLLYMCILNGITHTLHWHKTNNAPWRPCSRL
jgi:hypothetical protein